MDSAVNEKKERRRLQNRLAQQRFRQRIKCSTGQKIDDDTEKGSRSSSKASGSRSKSHERSPERMLKIEGDDDLSPSSPTCGSDSVMTLFDHATVNSDALQTLLKNLLSPSPCAGIAQLFMPQFHFVHALYGNAARMGVKRAQINDYWCISSIGQAWAAKDKGSEGETISRPLEQSLSELIRHKDDQRKRLCSTFKEDDEVRQWRLDGLPTNMQPTELQRTVEHHPYIDVAYPWPVMRDRILLLMDVAFDEDELCHWTMHAQERIGEAAFTIWGDDLMDESAYEVSETFARQWWFLLDQNIMRRTNWWRRQRGVPPIKNEWIV